MPKVNVYLPDDLARTVRDAGVPISAVCQQALADAVAAADSEPRPAAVDDGDESGDVMSRVTRRARDVLEHARSAAKEEGRKPTTVDIVDGFVAEGGNLALVLLAALDIDPADLSGELRALSRRRGAARPGGLRGAAQRAAAHALEMGHNYVGCEHLLLGLATGPEDELAAATLARMGADAETVRRSVMATLAGYAAGRQDRAFGGLSAPIRAALDDIRARLARLESR